MTRDDIIRMAREAGMPPVKIVTDKPVVYPVPEALERFAALVAAAEREACAKVCDIKAEVMAITGKFCDPDDLAAAIRARGQA